MSVTGIGEIFSFGESILNKFFPDPQQRAEHLFKLEQLKQEGNLAGLHAEVQLLLAQAEINKEEARSDKWWKAGWRPFVGWMCGLAFAYATILEPLMRFVAKMYGYVGEFPVLDTNLTMQVLIGMLGLGIMRTREKEKKVTTVAT